MAASSATQAARALLARRSDVELEFVQHRSTGVVHVITPADPTAEQLVRPLDADALLDWAVGTRHTMCGYVARRHLGGLDQGDKVVDDFDTAMLCRSCHRALGDHAHRIFEQVPATTDWT